MSSKYRKGMYEYSQESNGWSGEERGETNDSKKEGKKEKTQGGVQQVEKTIIDTNMMVQYCALSRGAVSMIQCGPNIPTISLGRKEELVGVKS